MTITKQKLWMLIADMNHPCLALAVPTLAWMAEDAKAKFECYLECERDGTLFARTGSTVIGGHHHQQFNYLNAVFDVEYIILGEASVFASSIEAFNAKTIAQSNAPIELYQALLARDDVGNAKQAIFATPGLTNIGERSLELAPYLYPDIFFNRALALPLMPASSDAKRTGISSFLKGLGIKQTAYLYLSNEEKSYLREEVPNAVPVDELHADDTYGRLTLRIAERWKHKAEGLAFGDPAAILTQLPSLCRERRVSVYGEIVSLHSSQVIVSPYTEEKSEIADDVIRLANEIGNRVIVGRQTGDGDLFHWSKGGVCIKIMDPNRPAFPVVETVKHKWANPKGDIYADEPDDAMLERYAEAGKVLATFLWHSGEMAHNEAMLNLFEVASFTKVKMGIGVHAARYETAPQTWELLSIARGKGGVRGLIEPVLHSGGMGVMAEVNCPPEILREHCQESLTRICEVAGAGATPRGYYAFMDSDMHTLQETNADVFRAVEASGMNYFVSSAQPGRNRVLANTGKCIVLNQTCRSVAQASPFLRATTVEELKEDVPRVRPGWLIATLDAPVIAFSPYIWHHGRRFMRMIEWLLTEDWLVNVLPHTVSRYARLLEARGYLPKQ